MTQPTEPADDRTPESEHGAPGEYPPVTPQWPSQPAPETPAAMAAAPPSYGPAPQTSTNAIAALVLSIVAWVICPIIPAIIALVFASKADREIAASNGWVTGGGLVTAAKIVAWINIGLYGALIAIGVLVLIVAVVGGALV